MKSKFNHFFSFFHSYDGILDEEFWDDNEVLPKEKKERKVKKVGEKRKKMTREGLTYFYFFVTLRSKFMK